MRLRTRRDGVSAPAASPPDRPSYEEQVRAATGAVVSATIEILRALREEIEKMMRSGEAAVGRVKGALVRSLHALQRALVASLLAALFVALGAIVLSIFLVAVLNRYLGDPWGTGLAALLLLLAAGFFAMRARSEFGTMKREAEALTRGPR